MNKVTLTLTRADGSTEVKDMTSKFPSMTKQLARRIREANAAVGTTVHKIEWTHAANNHAELVNEYRKAFLEGGEGYIPDMTQDPRFRSTVITEEF